jgi:hypothetical protein
LKILEVCLQVVQMTATMAHQRETIDAILRLMKFISTEMKIALTKDRKNHICDKLYLGTNWACN